LLGVIVCVMTVLSVFSYGIAWWHGVVWLTMQESVSVDNNLVDNKVAIINEVLKYR
jgi:hypothetical protein